MQRWEVCADLEGQEALSRYGRRERLISSKEYNEQRLEEATGYKVCARMQGRGADQMWSTSAGP